MESSTIRLVLALINRITRSHSAVWDAIYTAFQAFLHLRSGSTRAEYAAELNETPRSIFVVWLASSFSYSIEATTAGEKGHG